MLPLQLEVHCRERRELDVEAALPILPRDVLRPDFAEVSDVRTAEHFGISIENFFPGSTCRGSQAIILANDWRKVEYAKDHVAVVIFTYKAYDGIVRVVAPNPFETSVIVVDFPKRGVFLVDVVQDLHHLQHFAVAIPADEVPVERLLLVPFAELPEFVAHEVELLAGVCVLESVGESQVCELLPVVAGHLT